MEAGPGGVRQEGLRRERREQMLAPAGRVQRAGNEGGRLQGKAPGRRGWGAAQSWQGSRCLVSATARDRVLKNALCVGERSPRPPQTQTHTHSVKDARNGDLAGDPAPLPRQAFFLRAKLRAPRHTASFPPALSVRTVRPSPSQGDDERPSPMEGPRRHNKQQKEDQKHNIRPER